MGDNMKELWKVCIPMFIKSKLFNTCGALCNNEFDGLGCWESKDCVFVPLIEAIEREFVTKWECQKRESEAHRIGFNEGSKATTNAINDGLDLMDKKK